MSADYFTSPRQASKIKTKLLASKMKSGSPKFQDVLRERCRERMKEKRGQMFSKRRLHLEDPKILQNEINKMIHHEFKVLTTNENHLFDIGDSMTIDEALALESELLEEEEKWMMAEYEKILQEEEQMYMNMERSEECQVFCPMCQRAFLIHNWNCFSCKNCCFVFPAKCQLEQLKMNIDKVVEHHSVHCSGFPGFVVVNENEPKLYLSCSNCFEYALIL